MTNSSETGKPKKRGRPKKDPPTVKIKKPRMDKDQLSQIRSKQSKTYWGERGESKTIRIEIEVAERLRATAKRLGTDSVILGSKILKEELDRLSTVQNYEEYLNYCQKGNSSIE